MAEYTVETAAHKTLTGTAVDTITMPSNSVRIINRTGAGPLWVTTDGTQPVAEADNILVVPPGTWIEAQVSDDIARHTATSTTKRAVIKVLGNGNAYTVEETW